MTTHQPHPLTPASTPRGVSRYNHSLERRRPATGSGRLLYGLFRLATVALTVGLIAMPGTAPAEPAHLIRGEVVALAHDNAAGMLIAATTEAIYRRGDDDRDWTKLALPPELPGGRIEAMAVAAQGKWIYVAAPGGVLRSGDGGKSWTAAGDDGLPAGDIVALAAHADRADTVYVHVAGRGIFRSEDGGSRWQLMDEGPQVGIVRLIHSAMPGSMQTGWLFAATDQGVRRSMDCFCGWRPAGGLDSAVRAVAYDPAYPRRIYAATVEGLFSSPDGGEAWDRMSTPSPRVTALVATPAGILYAADSGGALFRSTDHARTWERVDA